MLSGGRSLWLPLCLGLSLFLCLASSQINKSRKIALQFLLGPPEPPEPHVMAEVGYHITMLT